MSQDTPEQPRSVAIEQLKFFGLSAYAAQTFLALLEIEVGTAQQISEASTVPRTRVYDAVDELEGHGIVDIQHSNPKRFRAVSAETAGKYFQQQCARRLDSYHDAVAAIDTTKQSEQQRGVWTVIGHESINKRITTFIESAEDEIVFMSVEPLLTDEIVDSLSAAQERGVSIRLGKMSEAANAELNTLIPEADVLPSLWEWDDSPSGRVLMVDDTKTLVSVRPPETESGTQPNNGETAIWGTGPNNSLVVVLRGLFTWQLDSSSFE